MNYRNQNAEIPKTEEFKMTREGFINYVIAQVKANLPGCDVNQVDPDDDFHYRIEMSDKKSLELSLDNAWNNYQRTGDLEVIRQFLTVQKELNDKISQLENKGLSLENVYPVLRPANFSMRSAQSEDEKARLISDTFSEALKVLYVEDNPNFVSFVVSGQLPDGVTEDELSARAFENLKAQGWVEPCEKIDIKDIATVYIFEEHGKQYQAQFMVKEMYEEHLGDYFFVGFPTREITLVVAWHKNPDDYIKETQDLAIKLKMMTEDMYNNYTSPISPLIHRITEGDVKLLG